MPVEIPAAFREYAARSAEWRAWLDALPALLRSVLDEWVLAPDGAATHGSNALVVPVRTVDGEAAMLKLGWPHWEAEHEHLALRDWDGAGAVRLLRADPRRSLLLLERADAAHDLTSLPALEACEVVTGLYRQLHVPAPPQLHRLSTVAGRWSAELLALPRSAPVPRRYVEQAASLARDFAADPATDGRLVHTDLHYFNVLASDRQPWLVIDPKPLSGDPHHEVAPLLWNRWEELAATGDVRTALRRRFHTVVETAGFDEDRARDWVVVRELVNVLWELTDPNPDTDGEWVTQAVTIAKAVQD